MRRQWFRPQGREHVRGRHADPHEALERQGCEGEERREMPGARLDAGLFQKQDIQGHGHGQRRDQEQHPVSPLGGARAQLMRRSGHGDGERNDPHGGNQP